jgi:hypothetical protein
MDTLQNRTDQNSLQKKQQLELRHTPSFFPLSKNVVIFFFSERCATIPLNFEPIKIPQTTFSSLFPIDDHTIIDKACTLTTGKKLFYTSGDNPLKLQF